MILPILIRVCSTSSQLEKLGTRLRTFPLLDRVVALDGTSAEVSRVTTYCVGSTPIGMLNIRDCRGHLP